MAGGNILSISYIDGVYHYLEVDKKTSGYFPQHPQITDSPEALFTLCRKAGEIHLSTIFPSAIYRRELFPKVSKRYMPGLVKQDATEKMGVTEPVLTRFVNIKEVTDSGVAKWQTAYCALLQKDVLDLWETFSAFKKKIKFVSPMSVSVASMVSKTEAPEENFAVVWVGHKSSLMVIASPEGYVHVARSVPLSLDRKKMSISQGIPQPGKAESSDEIDVDMDRLFQEASEEEDQAIQMEDQPEPGQADMDTARTFSRELEKELGMTTTFFKQEFRQAAPKKIYLLGNPNLKKILDVYPLPSTYEDVRLDLNTEKHRGLSSEFAGENIHLLGNLFIPEVFNFIPEQEAVKRKSNMLLNAALVLLVAGLGLSIVWTDRTHHARSEALREHSLQVDRLRQAQAETAALQAEANRLKPIEGWKNFYDTTMGERPPWNMFVSELAILMEDYVLINNFQVQSGEGINRNCRLQGKIKAENWEEGLDLFRSFGKKIQSSKIFEISNISYAPEGVSSAPSMFDFEMDIKLKGTGGI